MMGRRILAGLSGFVLAISLWILSLAVLLQGAGTTHSLMENLMRSHAPSSYTGLPQEQYSGVAGMICGFLAGEIEDFQYVTQDAYGRSTGLFQAHEQQHMEDCRQLFRLDRMVMLVCMIVSLLCIGSLCFLRQRYAAAKGCLTGGILALVLLTVVALWAVFDFDGLFILFHRLSFANNLWLLNPSTDLLIRLMPIGFFIHYVTLIGITWLLALLLMIGICCLLLRRPRQQKRGYHHEL